MDRYSINDLAQFRIEQAQECLQYANAKIFLDAVQEYIGRYMNEHIRKKG